MNRSGHSEMPDPDWFMRERAKVSPSTLDTDQSITLHGGHSSFASLNLDALTVADLDHFSVRSLPVNSQSGGTNASIAYEHDAPWNESPRSMRSARARMSTQSLLTGSMPPPGVSAIDHLNNSISSLKLGGTNSTLPHSIITEEVYEYDSEGSESVASLHMHDLSGPSLELDATAHAGNVSTSNVNARVKSSSFQLSSEQLTASPLPSPQRVRRAYISGSNSIAGSSITTRASARFQQLHAFGVVNTSEPSISTLGDDTDDDDDDNLAIIKLLRSQVTTLKQQLMTEQEKNLEKKSKKIIATKKTNQSSLSSGASCDSFGGDTTSDESFGNEECDADHSKSHKMELQTQTDAVLDSIAAFKETLHTSSNTTKHTNCKCDDDQVLLNELLLCELESHYRQWQQQYASTLREQKAEIHKLKQHCHKQADRIAELDTQLMSKPLGNT